MKNMVDMSRDTDQLSEMVHNGYDSEYPVNFFLDPRMVRELGLEGREPGEMIKIGGVVRIMSLNKDDEKTEMNAAFVEMVVMDEQESSTKKMSEAYKDEGNDG